MAISGIDISKFEDGELPDIAGYKTSVAQKAEKKAEKDFKGKKEISNKPAKKSEEESSEKSDDKKPATKKPAAKKPAAKKPAAKKTDKK